jgi:hypothetical protein
MMRETPESMIRASIANVLGRFRAEHELDDDAIVKRLIADGMEPALTERLVVFLPMVYFRIMMERTKIVFPDVYQEKLPDGTMQTRVLSNESVWEPSFEFARAEIKLGMSSEDLLNVAGRAAECDAINKLLNAGSKIEDCKIDPCIVRFSC